MTGLALAAERRVFPRFAGRLIRTASNREMSEEFFRDLMQTPTKDWLRVIHDRYGMEIDDDPVPEVIREVLRHESVNLGPLRDSFYMMPLRESAHSESRIMLARQAMQEAMAAIWNQALRSVRFRSPLLVLPSRLPPRSPHTPVNTRAAGRL